MVRRVHRAIRNNMGVPRKNSSDTIFHQNYQYGGGDNSIALSYSPFAYQAAETELDAFIFQRIAEMMHGYHTQVGPISKIIPVRQVVVGYTADQKIVVTLPLDYLYWTERAALGLNAVTRLESADRPVKRVELWITGRTTPKAKRELEAKGLAVKEQTGERLMPPSMEDKTIELEKDQT